MVWERLKNRRLGLFLGRWLFSHRFVFVLMTFLSGALALFIYVYDMDWHFFLHLMLVFCFLSAVFLSWDLLSSYRSYRDCLLENDFKVLSASEKVLEEKVLELKKDKQVLLDRERQRQSEFLDYFTLWAHQIKTPIAASSLVLAGMEGEDSEHLRAELFRIEQYTDSVMQYLRLENFHEDLYVQEENIGDLVRQVIRKYSLFFIKGQVKLDLGEMDQTFVTDKKWFAIVLEQLISNALKYTSQGRIWIGMVGEELWIQDEGIGIQTSDLSRVFERGFSGYNGRISQQSSGLGLYLVKRITDNLGHAISLESEVGKGTLVKISLKQATLAED